MSATHITTEILITINCICRNIKYNKQELPQEDREKIITIKVKIYECYKIANFKNLIKLYLFIDIIMFLN